MNKDITIENVTAWAKRHAKEWLSRDLDDLDAPVGDLGMDSLDHVEALFEFEEEFTCMIEDDVLEGFNEKSTVRQVIEALVKAATT